MAGAMASAGWRVGQNDLLRQGWFLSEGSVNSAAQQRLRSAPPPPPSPSPPPLLLLLLACPSSSFTASAKRKLLACPSYSYSSSFYIAPPIIRLFIQHISYSCSLYSSSFLFLLIRFAAGRRARGPAPGA
eukprot:475319-Pyramimonas_sp.AAC.1